LMNPRLKKKNSKHIFKHTITRLIPVLVLSFFLSSKAISQDKNPADYLLSEKIISKNQGSSIETARFYKNGVIYNSQERLFFNQDQINYINAQDETIKNIIVKGNDFFIASGYGVYQNYRRIFSKGPCYHVDFSPKTIHISCAGGIYRSSYDPKASLQNFDWQLVPLSPNSTYFFTLNRSGSEYEYAVAENGFYFFNTRKNIWTPANNNLKRDLNNSFGFGRFCVITKNQSPSGKALVILGASSGIFVSSPLKQTWQKISTGLKPNPNGVFEIREIKKLGNEIFAVTSTGIYSTGLNKIFQSPTWKRLEIQTASRDENNNQNFFSMDINAQDEIIASNSQGEIFKIHTKTYPIKINTQEVYDSPAPHQKNSSPAQITTDQTEKPPIDINLINKILKLEPNVHELHIAALNFSGIPDGKSFKKYRRQARLRNFLPSFEASANQDANKLLSLETSGGDVFSSNTDSISTSVDEKNVNRNNNQNSTGIKFEWELGNIIYDPEVNNLITSARLSANIRENLLTEITQIYYSRKELVLELLQEILAQNDLIPIDNLKKILKINEYTAQLDARTDGWFSQSLKNQFSKANLGELSSTTYEQIKEIFHVQ
jgi:hypothetical protein